MVTRLCNNLLTNTLDGLGCAFRGRKAIISWYENSSISVHCIALSRAKHFPNILLQKYPPISFDDL